MLSDAWILREPWWVIPLAVVGPFALFAAWVALCLLFQAFLAWLLPEGWQR